MTDTKQRWGVEVGDPHMDEAWCSCGERYRIKDDLENRGRVRLRLMLWAYEHNAFHIKQQLA